MMNKHSFFYGLVSGSAGMAFVMLALALAAFYSPAPQETLAQPIPAGDSLAAAEQVRHWIGEADAPVTIIEFADFYCPYCGEFAVSEANAYLHDLVETGQARVGFAHLAFLGDVSTLAAKASECAGQQDAFWSYHDALFARIYGEQKRLAGDVLVDLAVGMGLDRDPFTTCMISPNTQAVMDSDLQLAASLGINSTPAFLINGRAVFGNQPVEVFEQYVEAALKEK